MQIIAQKQLIEGPSAPTSAQTALKSGYLTKQGGTQSLLVPLNWRRRFFVLTADGQYLYYYKTPEDLRPIGAIQLSSFQSIQEYPKKKYCWCLNPIDPVAERAYYAFADNEEEMQGWMEAIAPWLQNDIEEALEPPADPAPLPSEDSKSVEVAVGELCLDEKMRELEKLMGRIGQLDLDDLQYVHAVMKSVYSDLQLAHGKEE